MDNWNEKYDPAFIDIFNNSYKDGAYRSISVRKDSNRKMPVIIRFKGGYSKKDAEIRNNALDRKIAAERKMYSTINCCSTQVTGRELAGLVAEDYIKYIYYDYSVAVFLNTACRAINIPVLWKAGLSGRGVTAAVIDTGVFPHRDLTVPVNRIAAFLDFVNGRSNPYDDNGHGTHCAGSIAGNGMSSNGFYRGPAYEATILGIKALDGHGRGRASNIIDAVEWCIENRISYGIRVISLSFGAPVPKNYRDDPLCEVVSRAWHEGIVVCVAAGNSGPGRKTVFSPGIVPEIITVGAAGYNDIGSGYIMDYSNKKVTVDGVEKPDIIAPGVNIISLNSPGSYLDRLYLDSYTGNSYISMSGTSMAAPICAGLICLLLQKHPEYTPDTVKKLIIQSCHKRNMANSLYSSGYPDAYKLLIG